MNITDAIDIMESISGVTDESTPVGDAWNVILRYIHNPTPLPEPLSPAAMAVLDAFLNGCICNSADNSVAFQADRNGLAAALRALAVRVKGADAIRQDILDIATELEGTNGPV